MDFEALVDELAGDLPLRPMWVNAHVHLDPECHAARRATEGMYRVPPSPRLCPKCFADAGVFRDLRASARLRLAMTAPPSVGALHELRSAVKAAPGDPAGVAAERLMTEQLTATGAAITHAAFDLVVGTKRHKSGFDTEAFRDLIDKRSSYLATKALKVWRRLPHDPAAPTLMLDAALVEHSDEALAVALELSERAAATVRRLVADTRQVLVYTSVKPSDTISHLAFDSATMTLSKEGRRISSWSALVASWIAPRFQGAVLGLREPGDDLSVFEAALALHDPFSHDVFGDPRAALEAARRL